MSGKAKNGIPDPYQKRGRGRPKNNQQTASLLSFEKTQVVQRMLALGKTDGEIADAINVARVTLSKWKGRGRDERARQEAGEPPNPREQPYLNFLIYYEQADLKTSLKALGNLENAIEAGDVDVSIKYLERRNSAAFAPVRRDNTGGGVTGNTINILTLPDNRAALLRVASSAGALAALAGGYTQQETEDAEVVDAEMQEA